MILLVTKCQSIFNRCLVDVKWFRQWKKCTGFDSWDQDSAGLSSFNPGPIDNNDLFKGTCMKYQFYVYQYVSKASCQHELHVV